MAEIALKNKIVTIQDVIKISEILNAHYSSLKQQFEESKLENEGKEYNETFYRVYLAWGELKFSIIHAEAKEDRDDFEWFKNSLISNAKNITGINIYYDCSYKENCKRYDEQDNHEHFRLHLDNNMMGYGGLDKEFPQRGLSQDASLQIDEILRNLKPRYDTTLKYRTLFRMVPSFAISGILGVVLALVLFLSTRFTFLPIGLVDFIKTDPWFLAAGGIAVMVILGLILPNPSMELFKRIYIDKRYEGYDTTWEVEHYKDDYEYFQNQTEFTVGRFYGSDKAREKIKRNFKISAIISLICVVALVGLTVALYLI